VTSSFVRERLGCHFAIRRYDTKAETLAAIRTVVR